MDHVEDRIIGCEDQAGELNKSVKETEQFKMKKSRTNKQFMYGIFKNYSLPQKEQILNCEIKELNSG